MLLLWVETAGSVTGILGRPMRLCVGWALWEWKKGHMHISKTNVRCYKGVAVKYNESTVAPGISLPSTDRELEKELTFVSPTGEEACRMIVLSVKRWPNTEFYLQCKCVYCAEKESRRELGTHVQATLVPRHAGSDSVASSFLQTHQNLCGTSSSSSSWNY